MADEIKREALIIYLENLRLLESAIDSDKKREHNLKYALTKLVFDEKPPIEPQIPPKPQLNKKSVLFFIGAGVLALLAYYFVEMTDSGLIEGLLVGGLALLVIGYLLLMGLLFGASNLSSYVEKKKNYNFAVSQYPQSKSNYDQKLDSYNKRKASETERIAQGKAKINELLHSLEIERRSFENELSQAYNLNIIPLQFRNIEGIYYLYDYMSTSNESLSSALLQSNLEAIKEKLDEMINLQQELIIRQVQTNDMLLENNTRTMQQLQIIEQNSAHIRDYAEISAINSRNAMLMQKEQLEYQKADYWAKALNLY